MRLPRAGTHPARRPAPVLRIASVSGAIVRLGRGRLGRHPPSRTTLRSPAPVRERRTPRSPGALYRVDLAARARARSNRLHGPERLVSGFAPRQDPFGLTSTPRSRAALPSCASVRRHSCGDLGELGLLPFQGAQRVALGLPGTRGARPGGDPGPSDRCLLLTDSGFKDDRPKSRRTPHRTSPRDAGAPGSRRRAHFGEPTDRSRSVFFSERRSAGVPLMPRRSAGFPGRAQLRPPASARGRIRDLRVEPESLDRLHQAA